MKYIVLAFLLVTGASARSAEKCRIELNSGVMLQDAECLAVFGDSLKVASPDFQGWLLLSSIKAVYLGGSSDLVIGAGIGAFAGLVTGYLIGKHIDNQTVYDPLADPPNKKFKDSVIGGGMGLVAGGLVGLFVGPKTDYYFKDMSNGEKYQLLQRLILSPSN